MKKLVIASVLSAAALSANAAPLVTIGDQLDLFFRGAVIGKWDSNITYADAANNKIDDYSATFRLGAEADYGRNSKFKANVKFYEDITRYAQQKQFNSNLSRVYVNASYVESSLMLEGDFSFEQRFQNSSTTINANEIGALVRHNYFTAGVKATYDFTEKLYGELGGRWQNVDYLGNWSTMYSSYDIYSIPVSLLYRITPKISVGLSYQYRYTEFNGGTWYDAYVRGSNRDDHFAGINVRGEIFPKLSMSVYLGGSYRGASGIYDSDASFAANATMSYAATEKVTVYLTGKRDFGNGASRESSIDSSAELGVNYKFSSYLSATAAFSYLNSNYQQSGRDDNNYMGRIGLNYVPNKFIMASANYRYGTNSSNVANATYNQHIVELSVAVKY